MVRVIFEIKVVECQFIGQCQKCIILKDNFVVFRATVLMLVYLNREGCMASMQNQLGTMDPSQHVLQDRRQPRKYASRQSRNVPRRSSSKTRLLFPNCVFQHQSENRNSVVFNLKPLLVTLSASSFPYCSFHTDKWAKRGELVKKLCFFSQPLP